jgi:hypothetical protein
MMSPGIGQIQLQDLVLPGLLVAVERCTVLKANDLYQKNAVTRLCNL